MKKMMSPTTTDVVLGTLSFRCSEIFLKQNTKHIFSMAWQTASFNSTAISKYQQVRFVKYFSWGYLEKKNLTANIILGCRTSREIPPSMTIYLNHFFKEILCHLGLYWAECIGYTCYTFCFTEASHCGPLTFVVQQDL